MQNYSQTQASNLVTLAGFLALILSHFHINIGSDDIQTFIGAGATLFGLGWNWYHRYKQGDLTILGAKNGNQRYIA